MEAESINVIIQSGVLGVLLFFLLSYGVKIMVQILDRQEKSLDRLLATYEKSQNELLALIKTLCLPDK